MEITTEVRSLLEIAAQNLQKDSSTLATGTTDNLYQKVLD